MIKYIQILILFFLWSCAAFTQSSKNNSLHILFLGNSYTYVNDLPKICVDVAASAGNILFVDSHTIGGYTLQQHASDTESLHKIKLGNWDDVVLQEQSQIPSFQIEEVERRMLPYAHFLDSMIHQYNPKARTIFYMSWARKNGDSAKCVTWAPVCTYKGMDSLLALRYMLVARINHAAVSPVGAVWRYIRDNYPAIELYQSDQSHPAAAGSYAAACCFFTMLCKKDPATIKYNYTLSNTEALQIRTAVKKVVYERLLSWQNN